jgi:NADPH-dependent curcumin reductase CurA
VRKQLDLIAPTGVDVYFDNVGGDTHDAAMERMNEFGRVIYCGVVSSGYSNIKSTVKIDPLDNVVKALKLLGLRVDLYYGRAHEAVGWMVYWALAGKLKDRVHVIDGLENAPAALKMVFGGKNRGKMTVQVSPEPQNLNQSAS